ncbi:unnamed protein product [Ophioblennius macclurei]
MDSSPVLRQQSQNKIQRDLHRMKNEQNKKQTNPKSSKLPSSPRPSAKDVENKNPSCSRSDKKLPVRPGGSRLPVLAKSLQLPTPSSLSSVHGAWEDKPLAGKARKKKPCTRPVPFNFSQPRASRAAAAAERRQPNVLQSHAGAGVLNNPSKPKALQRLETDFSHLLLGTLSSTAKTIDGVRRKAASAASAEVCVDVLNQLTLHDPAKNSRTELGEKKENFQCDAKALLSIVRNEGVSASGRPSATPRSKAFDSLPQRVSIMKSHHKVGPSRGPPKSVQFSPDAAALQSILLNEGVRVGGGAAPPTTTPGRGTSIFTPLRVPVNKIRAESTDGPAALAVKKTPRTDCNPQRIRNNRQQPTSALRAQLTGLKSPFRTPGIGSREGDLQPRHQVVVQRLFEDEEEDEEEEKKKSEEVSTREEPEPLKAAETEVRREEKVEPALRTAFIQAPQRDSVIFFSSGSKLFRAPPVQDREIRPLEPLTSSSSSVETSAESAARKTCPLTPPTAILRRRFPSLEEARLDHEVATYTSGPAPGPGPAPRSGFLPPRPRCGNPLASFFEAEDSTRFVPIDVAPLCCTNDLLHSQRVIV